MLKKLINFLQSQHKGSKEEAVKKWVALREEKAEFVQHSFLEFVKHLDAYYNRHKLLNKEKGGYYKDRLKQLTSYKRNFQWISCPSKEIDLPDDHPWIDDDFQIKIFKQFLTPNYNPPIDNLDEFKDHFESLNLYYNILSRHWRPDMVSLDFVMAKIVRSATIITVGIHIRGKQVDHKLLLDRSRGERSEIKKQAALEAYYSLNRNGLKWVDVKREVVERLKSKGFIPKLAADEKPKDHTKQVERYLLSDKLIKQRWKK